MSNRDNEVATLDLYCLECGYNLTGNITSRCPECGSPFSLRELEQTVERVRIQMMELESINAWNHLALRTAVIGVALSIIATILGKVGSPALAAFAKLFSLSAGVGCIAMALGTLRVYSLPCWARGRMKERIDYGVACQALAVGTAVTSCALGLLSI